MGGLVLILQGASAVLTVGLFLLLLGLVLITSAVGVFRRRTFFWRLGIGGTVAFVVDGAINGFVLYGQPGDRGTLVNVVAAVLILACLLVGRNLFDGNTPDQGEAQNNDASLHETSQGDLK